MDSRRGAILVCVLVVMIVTGTVTMLGLRLLMATNRSQLERAKILQAQELVQLGRLALNRRVFEQPLMGGGEPKEISPIEMAVPAFTGRETKPAQIAFELLDADKVQWRVIVRYPYNLPGEVQATWQGHPDR